MSPPDASPSSSNALISGATENADANAGAPPSLTSLAPPAARVTVFLTRHGESEYNLEGRVGGDSGLSAMGQVYAGRLPGTLQTVLPPSVKRLHIWHSTLRRTRATAEHFDNDYPRTAFPALDEIHAGDCDGFTYEEIEEKWPEVMDERERDKYNFRYPSGESYSDIVARLLPLLSSLQKLLSSPSFLPPAPTEAVLIVGHQAVLRCLIAMLKRDVGVEEVPYVKVPLHTLMRLEWGSDALPVEKRWKLDVPGADTHREAQAKRKEPEEAEAANVIFALTPPSTETLVTGSTAAIAPSNEEETEDLLEIPQRPRGRSFSKFVMGDSH